MFSSDFKDRNLALLVSQLTVLHATGFLPKRLPEGNYPLYVQKCYRPLECAAYETQMQL